ncbi:MAG: hypothetical protein HYZ16_10190 [Bacteroidetes bacterium]|nr:hypothetical protein [Bacteroidota bacterium]
MTKKITQERIIQFVYGELPFEETAALFDELDNDTEGLDYLESVAGIGTLLGSLMVSPSKAIRDNVLAFSAHFTEE